METSILTVDERERLRASKKRAFEVYDNKEEKFKQFVSEHLEEYKKSDNSISSFNDEQLKQLKSEFQEIQENQFAKEFYSEFPLQDLWTIMGLALSADPTGISPIIFGAINFLFNKFGLFGSQEQMFKKIMEAVEEMIDKKLSEERRRQCILKFQALQASGDNYYKASKEYFQRNGDTNIVSISEDITSMTDELLSSTVQTYLIVFIDRLHESIIYFGETSELLNTIGFYNVAASLYASAQRDLVLYGKEWGFTDSQISGAKSNIISYNEKFYKMNISAGWKLMRHLVEEIFWPISTFKIPPYYDGVRKANVTNFSMFPIRAIDVQRSYGNHIYEVSGERGSYKIDSGNFLFSGWGNFGEALSTGFTSRFALADSPVFPFILTFQFPSAIERTMKIRFHHNIVGESRWTVSAGLVIKNIVHKQGEERGSIHPYYRNYEDIGSQHHRIKYTESELFTIYSKTMTLTCHRAYTGQINTGYKANSVLFMVEFIFE
ncbi:hypothetical protein ACTA71_010560 [Dictyostelium dimigraforme]